MITRQGNEWFLYKTSKNIFCVLLLTILLLGFNQNSCAGSFNYENYQNFLDMYVIENRQIIEIMLNAVDYEAIQKDKKNPDSLFANILQQLEKFDPATIEKRDDQIAFWINAYNIGAIKMIIDHYPVDSIRSRKINWFKNPWSKKILVIGNQPYSLGQIEHEILIGKYKESLIHFSIVCASLSCPSLSPDLYVGSSLKKQLEKNAIKFLMDEKKGVLIREDYSEVYFSQIFTFDKKSFPRGAADGIPLISRFLENSEKREYLLSGKYTIKYLDYDWSLNSGTRIQ